MKDIGYGTNCRYDRDAEGGFSGDNDWPDELPPQAYDVPVDRGFECKSAERPAWWEERRAELKS